MSPKKLNATLYPGWQKWNIWCISLLPYGIKSKEEISSKKDEAAPFETVRKNLASKLKAIFN